MQTFDILCVADRACRYKPVIIQHCLHVYGRSTAQDAAAGADAAAASSSSDSYVLDERQVCLHYARKLLRQRAVWPLHAFLPAWEQEVPGGCWGPQEEMLAGEALVLQPDPLEGVTGQHVRRLTKQQSCDDQLGLACSFCHLMDVCSWGFYAQGYRRRVRATSRPASCQAPLQPGLPPCLPPSRAGHASS